MTTWREVDLSNLILSIESGGRPKGGVSEDSGEIPSLGGENILLSGGVTLESVKRVPLAFFASMTKGILQKQDVLINKDGANTGKVGLYESQFPLASINEHLFLLRGKSNKLEQRFLYYLLLSPYGQEIIRSKISGSAQPGLKRDFIKDFAVNIPSQIQEQSTIADVIETVDQTITQTESLIAKYQRIKTGLMQDLLTRGIDENGNLRDPATHEFKEVEGYCRVPIDWEVSHFGKYVESSAFGPRFPATAYSTTGALAMIRTTDLDDEGNIINEALPRADLNPGDYRSHLLEPGDLLITRSGTIGITSLFESYEVPVIPGAFLIRFRLSSTALPDFYRYFFNSQFGRKLIHNSSAGGVQKNFKGSTALRLLVPAPHYKEQQRISTVLDKITESLRKEDAQLKKLYKIKTGLMQDLLTGKVSVATFLENT